jgi:hypothetical protein
LLATSFTVPTKPLLPLLRLCVLRLLELRLCVRRLLEVRLCGVRFALEPERFEPLLERDEPLRDERAFAPDELVLALLFEADPFDGLLLLLDAEPLADLLLVCLLPDVLPLAATLFPLRSKTSSK